MALHLNLLLLASLVFLSFTNGNEQRASGESAKFDGLKTGAEGPSGHAIGLHDQPREPATSMLSATHGHRSIIIPGTNWCGVGNISRDGSAVGSHVGADRCCREHDGCPYTIEGFTTKFNLYNFRFHTISHCECDDIFRTCLLSASSEQANHIGNLFFNVIGMRCFAFRSDMVCAQRTWWGRCEREKVQVSAEIRDRITY